MAAALTTVVVPARTMVIGIANGTTTMADIIAEAGAIIHQVAIGPGMVASEAGQFKTASASHIAATEIHLEIEAAEVGGLFNSVGVGAMAGIAQKIETFNLAFQLAWKNISEDQKRTQPNIARRLDDSIRRQLKEGATEPVFIASEALKDVERRP